MKKCKWTDYTISIYRCSRLVRYNKLQTGDFRAIKYTYIYVFNSSTITLEIIIF